MKKYVGPVHYSTRDYQTKAHTYQVSDVVSPIMQTVAAGISIKQHHDEAIKQQQEQEKRMNDRFDKELDRFAIQKIAEDERRAKDDAIREERNRRAYEEWDRMDATQREMDFDDQFRSMEEEQRISSILTREANRDRDIDARIARNDNASINAYMNQMDSYNKRMRRNENDIANYADYFDSQLDMFATSLINSEAAENKYFDEQLDRFALSQIKNSKSGLSITEKNAISALENFGYTKKEAASRVSSMYTTGMSEEDLIRAALRGH